jgi:hypothetical protein
MKRKQAVPQDTRAEGAPSLVFTGRDEMNIAEFPITLLCDRAPRGQNEIEFHDKINDPQNGRELVRTLTITAPEKYGLPTSTDDDVILALLQLTKQQNNFTCQEVYFTRLQLIEMLGWADKGASYTRIIQSLDRWSGTHLKYTNAWWDNEGRRWTNGAFHIIDEYKINDGRSSNGQGELFRSYVVWGKAFFKSCQAGYLKSLDYRLYVKLDYHTSKRMYRFLDKRFYHKLEWTFDLREFAFEHIGLSRAYAHNGKIKEKLQPAIEELEAMGFLEPLPKDVRFRKEGRDWKIVFKRAKAALPQPEETSPSAYPLVRELVVRGVTELTACELIQQQPEERIAAKIEVFDWFAEKKDKRIQKSPAGYLVESIRKDYAPPRGFESTAAREERQRKAAEVRRQSDEQRRLKSEAEARTQAEETARRGRVEAYWKELTPAQQSELMEAALAADPEKRATIADCRRNRLDHFARQIELGARDEYIERLLGEKTPA